MDVRGQNAGPVSQGLRVINPSTLHDENSPPPPPLFPESSSTADSSQSTTDSQRSCIGWPHCGFEDRTYRIGKLLGTYPLLAIIIGVSVVATGSMGFLNFHIESRPEELWVDRESMAFTARTLARTFPTENRIRLTILLGAPAIFQDDVFDLIKQIDDTVRGFSYRGKNWDDICFKKDSVCQKFSLLNFVGDPSRSAEARPEVALAVINQPGNRKFTLLPPYFIAPDDVLLAPANFTGEYNDTQLTRLIYFLQRQEPDRITSTKPVSTEDALRRRLLEVYGGGIGNVSVATRITYDELDDKHAASLAPFDYFPALLYSCIAFMLAVFLTTGKYSLVRNGFWLAITAVIAVGLAMSFGFGIASAVGMTFTPVHLILPVFLLGMTIFGFFVMEQELRTVADARPNLPRSEKMGLTMQRSFATLVLCLLANFLIFAVGIGSKLPVVRSFCVFGLTSSVGIFIVQVLFLFGCLSAWQGMYERTSGSWMCCRPKDPAAKDKSASLHSILKPAFGFMASNLSDNIGRAFVLLALAILTGVCIFFLFSLQIVFDLNRYDRSTEPFVGTTDPFLEFKNSDDSVACVYLGDIPYSERLSEFRTFHGYLRDHVAIRPRSIASWFDRYQAWFSDEARKNTGRVDNSTNNGLPYYDKSAFYRELVKFVFEKNFQEDVLLVRKSSDQIEILASRICFRFRVGMSAENYSSAVDNIVGVARDLNLGTALVDSKMLMEVLVQKTLLTELWILFGIYFVVLLIISALMLQSLVSALISFISYALMTIQSIGLLASQKVTLDSFVLVSVFCFVAITSHIIFYEATVFSRLSDKPKRRGRIKSALIHVGPIAVMCGLSAIAIFVPFFNSSVEVFRIIFKVAFTTVAVGFVHVFLFLPVALGSATPERLSTATLRFRERLRRSKSSGRTSTAGMHFDGGLTGPQLMQIPNDQVHFVARNPLERSSSTNSLRLPSKSAGLRAVLDSLPTPESTSERDETVVNNHPNAGHADRDSLEDIDIVSEHLEDGYGLTGHPSSPLPTSSAVYSQTVQKEL